MFSIKMHCLLTRFCFMVLESKAALSRMASKSNLGHHAQRLCQGWLPNIIRVLMHGSCVKDSFKV